MRVTCPRGWADGYFGVLTDAPEQKPRLEYRTEVFRLDEALLQKALALSHRRHARGQRRRARLSARTIRDAPANRAAAGDSVRHGHRRHLVGRAAPGRACATLDCDC